MKIGVDCNLSEDHKRFAVPKVFRATGMQTLDGLVTRLQTYRYDHHVDLVRIRFKGNDRRCVMGLTFVVVIQLFDFRADCREEVDMSFALYEDKPADVEPMVDQVTKRICSVRDELIGKCNKKKLRYLDGYLVVEPK